MKLKQKFDEFLNPKSMLTPGIAGGIIMGITNTLYVQFAISKSLSSLILSILLVIPILKKYIAPFYEKTIYCIFNSLLIFSVATNANLAGEKISSMVSHEKVKKIRDGAAAPVTERKFFDPYFE